MKKGELCVKIRLEIDSVFDKTLNYERENWITFVFFGELRAELHMPL